METDRFKDFLKVEKRRSTRTIDAYLDAVARFQKYVKKNVLLVAETDVRCYVRHLVRKNLKNSTVNQRIVGVKAFFQWLVDVEKRLPASPVPSGLSLKISEPMIEIPTREEIERMISSAKMLRDKAMIAILASSGLRISELLKLTKININADTGEIQIINGKGGRHRRSFMDTRALRFYREYAGQVDGNQLFSIGVRHAWYIVKESARRANITKRVWPHVLRHFFCTLMGRAGMSDTDLSKFSGHKNVNTLARYKNYDSVSQGEIYKKFSEKSEALTV